MRADSATPSITASATSGPLVRRSRPMNAPRNSVSHSGARSPSRCGRNRIGRPLRSAFAASSSTPATSRPIASAHHCSESPPLWVGPAFTVRPAAVGKVTTPGAPMRSGARDRQDLARAAHVDALAGLTHARRRTSPLQASITPATTGARPPDDPSEISPTTSVKNLSAGSRSRAPATRAISGST